MTPPDYPVIVVHLADDRAPGLTACSGDPMPPAPAPVYDRYPRYLCVACGRSGLGR